MAPRRAYGKTGPHHAVSDDAAVSVKKRVNGFGINARTVSPATEVVLGRPVRFRFIGAGEALQRLDSRLSSQFCAIAKTYFSLYSAGAVAQQSK